MTQRPRAGKASGPGWSVYIINTTRTPLSCARRLRTIDFITELNRADVLTKVLSPKVFAKMRDLILNVRRAAANIHSYVQHQIGVDEVQVEIRLAERSEIAP